jgi:hypothetical protein
MGQFKNPHSFELVWDSRSRVEPVPNSKNLICIGVARNSGQLYAAIVDPITYKNYTLYVNLAAAGTKFEPTFAEIKDESEHKAVDDYFLKVGVFEYYYKGSNWDWSMKKIESDKAGEKTNDTLLPGGKKPLTYGEKNKYKKKGELDIPDWFSRRFT